jgi:hypothetical protein
METKLFQRSIFFFLYSIKVPCSKMIQWSLISFSSPNDILQKNNPMFYLNSNGDKNYVT